MNKHPSEVMRVELDIHEILAELELEHLGTGAYRDVYALDDKRVLKIARVDWWGKRIEGIQANLKEMELWNCTHGYKNVQKWLAPCISLSSGGIALIQARTTPVEDNKLPKKVPNWITDLKSANGGMLDGKFVFHDYNLTMVEQIGFGAHHLVDTKIEDEFWTKVKR